MKLEASADSEGTSFFPFLAELTRELTARNAELKMEQNGCAMLADAVSSRGLKQVRESKVPFFAALANIRD